MPKQGHPKLLRPKALRGVLVAVMFVCALPALARGSISVNAKNFEFSGVGLVGYSDRDDDHVVIRRIESDGVKQYVVSDDAGVTPSGPSNDCVSSTPQKAICGLHGYVEVYLGDGADRVHLEGGARANQAIGGRGDDLVVGSFRKDQLGGRQGNDIVRGRGGPDFVSGFTGADATSGGPGADLVSGGTGPDSMYGGRGDDRIDAHDDHYDSAIDCGPGHDVAFVDPGMDPRPVACEIVRPFAPRH